MKRIELFFIERNPERRAHITKLLELKKYEEIYQLYGRKIYNTVISNKYKNKDIDKLISEGRFEDIYVKYGKENYNKRIYDMQAIDVYNETGSKFRSFLNKAKNKLLHRVAPVLLSTSLATATATPFVLGATTDSMKNENAIKYAEEIEKYNEKIDKYAEEVRALNLDDTKIMMKVMSDMWAGIKGYGKPKLDISGFYRLDLANEDGVGVCRNMADDVTAKLNAINPKYNARNFIVKIDTEQELNMAKIDRNIIQTNETVAEKETEQNKKDEKETENKEESVEEGSKFSETILGNHVVTAVDIPEQNITLIVDPTNPGLGVFKNGKIYMFSSPNGESLEIKPIGDVILKGTSNTIEVVKDIAKSFLPCELELDELEKIYGTEAQNKALEELKKLEDNNRTTFIEKYKVEGTQEIGSSENNVENKNIELER